MPLDFSPSSDAALEMATDLAQHFQAAFHLVHVVPMFPLDRSTEFFSEVKFFDDAALLQGVKTNTEPAPGAMPFRSYLQRNRGKSEHRGWQ